MTKLTAIAAAVGLSGYGFFANEANCGCAAVAVYSEKIAANARTEMFDGRPHLVFPVIMLRHTVVNNALVEVQELRPETWNGVPVTVMHPVDNEGRKISANSPQVMEKYTIGTIYNARLDGDMLRAEAWIDVNKANRIGFSAVVKALQVGENMDVSTGYFATYLQAQGKYNDKAYNIKHTDIKPDHLALLPGVEGACSWADGCGVRNEKSFLAAGVSAVKDALVALATNMGFTINIEGNDMDKAKMLDFLVEKKIILAANRAEFEKMSDAVIKSMYDGVVANAAPAGGQQQQQQQQQQNNGQQTPPAGNSQQQQPPAGNQAPQGQQSITLNADVVAALNQLPNVLAYIGNQQNAEKAQLIARITANSTMKAEDLQTKDLATLQMIANGLNVSFDYSGQGAPVVANDQVGADVVAAMSGVQLKFGEKKTA